MNFNEYTEQAMRTAKLSDDMNYNLIHAALGLGGEAGEFVDAVKKAAIYKKELDRENLLEEMGDILWYLALASHTLGVDLGQIAKDNVEKLSKRYPEKYTDQLAVTRLDKV